ncbi:hypothetical protein V8E36_005338 [Tilletia maclaganii]
MQISNSLATTTCIGFFLLLLLIVSDVEALKASSSRTKSLTTTHKHRPHHTKFPTTTPRKPTSRPSKSTKTKTSTKKPSHSTKPSHTPKGTQKPSTKPPTTSKASPSTPPKSSNTPSQATPPTKPASTLSAQDRQALDAHNAARAKHNAQPLTWDAKLAEYARNWGEQCIFAHTSGPDGENLAAGTNVDHKDAVQMWMNEAKYYNKGDDFSSATGHFTQVVWKGSKQLGCALITTCSDSQLFSRRRDLSAANNNGTIASRDTDESEHELESRQDPDRHRAARGFGSSTGNGYVVCEYYPPGNVIGAFSQNVDL